MITDMIHIIATGVYNIYYNIQIDIIRCRLVDVPVVTQKGDADFPGGDDTAALQLGQLCLPVLFCL